MKLTKRLVAVALAILMIFGSISVAMTASAADGTTFGITTKILRNVNGLWVETDKVNAGEEVKLGVYLDTDFYAGDGSILMYYNNQFFEPAVSGTANQTLTVGSAYGEGSTYKIEGYYSIGPNGKTAASVSQQMEKNGKIDSAYSSTHDPLYVVYNYGTGVYTQKFDGSKLFCEIPLKVKEAPAATTGYVEAPEAVTASVDFTRGKTTITKGGLNVIPDNADDIWTWNAILDYNKEPVTLYTNCTSASFNANYGKFEIAGATGITELYTEGEAGETLKNLIAKDSNNKVHTLAKIAEPVRDGYSFAGWKVEGADDSTASKVNVYPDSDTKYVAVWEKEENDGDNLGFRTEIYRLDENGEWVYTDKVMPGEEVKARLFIETEYNAGDGQLLLFYDGDFFEDSYAENAIYDATFNDSPTSIPGAYGIEGQLSKPTADKPVIKRLIEHGYIDAKYVNDHPAFVITYLFPTTDDCQKFSDDEWFVEIDLKVKENAVNEGAFFIKENTIYNTTDGLYAFVDISRETAGDPDAMSADSMRIWDADVTIDTHPVSINNTIRFDANGGEFDAENTETYTIDGTVGEKVDYSTIPAVSRPGYTFMGWIDSADDTPTLEEAKTADQLEATMTHNSIIEGSDPAAAIIYNAFWVSNVNVTFANINPETGAVEEIKTINVTAGEPFEAVEDPELDGYRFIGWASYYNEGKIDEIGSLPEKYPTESTTYYAVYSALQYRVNYYVLDADIENPTMDDFKLVSYAETEFGTPISASPYTYNVPEGYAISVAYSEVLYGDEILFLEAGKFVAGTTMPATAYNLYYYIERAEFDAIFDANEGAWADGDTIKTVPAVFDEEIAVPENPVREGYEFIGWLPDATIMDEEGKTFIAQWDEAVYTATYHVDEDSFVYDMDFGAEFEYPADPDNKTGYKFLGWAEEEGSTTLIDAFPETMPAKNLDYYAVYEVIDYTITFENTGDTAMDAITLPYGTEIGEIAEPTKTGYTFAGWDVEIPATMPAEDITATAKWTVNQYTVTWDVDGTKTVVTYDYLAPVDQVEDPVKTGYTFTGWNSADVEEIPAVMPAKDITFTAVFEANTYDALFLTKADNETHDGKFESKDSTVIVVPTVFGEEIVAPTEVPVRTGYTFVGWDPIVGAMDEEGKEYFAVWTPNAETEYKVEFWSMDTAGDYKLVETQTYTGTSDSVITIAVAAPFNYTIDADMSTYDDNVTINPDGSTVVTVYFELNQFVVEFVGNGGTVDGEAEVSNELRYGAQVRVPAVEREGYTFKGWYDAAEGGNALDVNLTAVETVTYYAQWEINQYTITFETVGGTEIPAITQDYATAVTAPADPTKLGHTFAGWDKEIPATMPAEDMTITAQWTVNTYDATFFAGNEGFFVDDVVGALNVTTVENIVFGEEITAPAQNPVREGYDFIGWSTDGTTVLAPVGIMDAEGKEFIAVWEVNQYTITFDTKGGNTIDPITQDYATAVTAPADPVKEGYTFAGWDVAVPATMPAEDITITAKWDVNSYDATFDAGEDAVFESTGDATVTTPVDYNDDITAPDEEPTKTGYTFVGWEDEDGNIIYAGETAGEMDADGESFTAVWAPNEDTEYKVVVNYTDAQTGAHADEFLYTGTTGFNIAIVEENPDPEADETAYVLMSDLAVAGYVLDENADNQLTGTIAADGSTVLNLYYKATKVTATFDANGGAYYDTTTSKSVEIDYNALAAPVAPAGYDAPSKEGYTFGGWQGLNDSTRLKADRTFTAIWTPNEYTINWDVNGDAAEGTSTETYEYAALITKKVADTREGYKFVEWVDENGAAITIPDNMPAKNLTIIAKYEVESFTINFNTDGGSAVDSITQAYGTAIKAPAAPTKEGYTFAGWSPELPATMPDLGETGDATELIAQWTKNNYTVTYFVKNPATGAFDKITTATVAYADPISTVFAYTAPTGYTLVAVAYTDTGLTAALADDAKMPAADVNLYYDVIANEYDAIFSANGGAWGDGDTSKTVKASYNGAITAPAAPSLEGYEFAGWTPAVDTMNEEGKTFTAQWTAKTYKATYKANGGVWGEGEAIETTQVFDVVYGSAVTAPTAAPTRVGYTFKGWDKTAPATMPAEDLVFTAKWEINSHTITFKDGDKTVGTVTGDYGSAVAAPAEPTKEGYTFTGWDANVPATMPDENVTINATWEINKYDVVWNVDGVTTIVKDVPYGTTISKVADPVKTGYEFAGWTGYTDGMTMPANDVEFVATFTAKTYTVTFDANGGEWDGGKTTQTVTGEFGAALAAPVAPGRTGYTFQTWSPSVPTTMPAENATYKAIWATAGKVDYTVETYYMNTLGTYEDVLPVATYGTATIDAYVKLAVDEAPAGFTYDATADNFIEGIVAADGSTVFTVYYARNTYTIKFVGNEGTIDGNAEKSATYYYGTTVAAPTAVRTGYDFAGWANADGEIVAVEATALADATYYAQWTEATYTATFKAYPGAFADGETTVTVEYAYGDAIAKAADPVREGYTFAGWEGYTDGMTIGAEDVTFTATWTPKSYNAVFYTDDTMTETHDTKTANYTEEYNVTIDPSKVGHDFAGWYDAATNKPAGLPEAGEKVVMPLGGAEYYATWTVNSYNLVYRANGGAFDDASANKTYSVEFGTVKADMPAPADPVREGYTFAGYTPALPATMPANQVNLIAQWEINTYTATFDAIDGVFEENGETTVTTDVTFEDSLFAPDEVPLKDGYEFSGWEDADGNVYNPGDEIGPMGADNVGFTAIWTAVDSSYVVKHIYMDAEGSYDNAEVVIENLAAATDSTVTAAEMAKDNFTFDAAASTVEGVVKATGTLVLELYYVREQNKFTTYDETGKAVSTEDVYFDAPLKVEDPAKEGYTFAGWTDAQGNPVTVPATMPGEKLDIYESWTVNSYNVTFDANTGAFTDNDVIKTVATAYGTAIKAPADVPVKAGHTFKGWFDAEENGYSVDTYTSMPELAEGETLTFYARWEANKNDYRIEIYEMNPDGTMPTDPTSMVINNALVGETVEANVTVPAGFTLDTANSVLKGVVPEEGVLVLKVVLTRAPHKFTAIVDGVALVDGVEYYFDETVVAIDTPVKDGYTFAGWTATAPGGIVEEGAVADAKYPARMPNNDVTIYGVWSTNSYNAIFDAGEGKFESTDLSTETVPVVFGEKVTAPTEVPVQEGFEFAGWKAEDGTVYQPGDEIADAMTSAGATFEAVWNKSNFTVTFYGYEALTESPYKSENATMILGSKTYAFDAAIEFPAAPENIDAQYYTFLGWSKTEGGAVMSNAELYNQKMPAEDTAYYAVYERVEVKLIPNDDAEYWVENDKTCTTVIDRTGDNWYVYGLHIELLVDAGKWLVNDIDTYVDVSGDGYYEVTDFKAKEGMVGTGTVINVYDNVTGELVETFTIIIYGDINGDGEITKTDASLALAEADGTTNWSKTYHEDYCHYKAKAAAVNGSGVFNQADPRLLDYYVAMLVDIDQVNGCIAA